MTSRDIVAAEAHYHHSCYKNYTRIKTKECVHEGERKGGDEMVDREAYANLVEYIRTDIIPNKKIVPITCLTAKLESFMPSGALNESARKNSRRRLESQLGGSVCIFPDDKGWLLMVPDSVTLQDVVLENQSLRRLEFWKAKVNDLHKIIDQASSRIRSAIKENTGPIPWPYHPSDVDSSAGFSYHMNWIGF